MNNSNVKLFTELRRSYEDCYVKEHAGLPEYDSRGRRLRRFKDETKFIEELRRPSPEHDRILQIIKHGTNGSVDHSSYWWERIGEHVWKAVVLIEPYHANLADYKHPDLSIIQVPPRIAPYGGGGFINEHGKLQPGTNSFLVMSKINESKLQAIGERLIKAASTMPEWDSVE